MLDARRTPPIEVTSLISSGILMKNRKQNITPWDMGGVQPSLKEVMENSRIHFPRSGKVLVPGCGTVSEYVTRSESRSTSSLT
jgi:hypothetical protein